MTRKDFELIASAQAASRAEFPRGVDYIDQASNKLATALASTNPLFDRQRFLAACGVAS